MTQSVGILAKGPVRGVFIDVGPSETAATVGRVPEIVDLVARFTEAGHDFGVVWIPPAGGDIDS
jgi:hypothetical protein